tara:strand:+ start:1 stop:1083 length:1083 start_codon:yes stop_codon:yes gene_type:complete
MAYISFQPSDYFNTLLYTDNGANRTLTGVGFQPDWVWIKTRNHGNSHNIFDAVRGANKNIRSNSTAAEVTTTDTLTAFTSDGFSLGVDASGYGVNYDNKNEVAWNWKANGQGSSNTDGSINTTYTSANTTSGFSISQYGGNGTQFATVGHGLGVAPNVIMIKNLTGTTGWIVYHDKAGLTGSTLDGEAEYKMLSLNTTDAASDNGSDCIWGSTSTRYKIDATGTASYLNSSGSNYIAYCFAEKTGYSKFGSYTGNGNVDGSFIYTNGMKPAFVMVKKTSASGDNWSILDNKRNTFNVMDKYLDPNSSNAEGTADICDFTSNGFKMRNTFTGYNASGETYIFMAFAEEPLVSSNGVPATAR